MSAVTIPGALADHITASNPRNVVLRATLDNARRGRGRTLIIEPSGTHVLHLISAHAEALLINRGLHTPAEIRAARTWIDRIGHAPTEFTAAQSADRYIAREFPAVADLLNINRQAADDEARYAAALVTEAEATEGTWRGEWIGPRVDDALFTMDTSDAEQGALFA
jgi:hypothetical protein